MPTLLITNKRVAPIAMNGLFTMNSLSPSVSPSNIPVMASMASLKTSIASPNRSIAVSGLMNNVSNPARVAPFAAFPTISMTESLNDSKPLPTPSRVSISRSHTPFCSRRSSSFSVSAGPVSSSLSCSSGAINGII